MKKISNLISTIIIILCFIYLLITVGPRLLGYQINVVLSNSMEPVYTTGELLLVRPIAASDVEINDIISFKGSGASDNVITHRVVGIDEDMQVFITKGDANDSNDSNPVTFNRLNGIVEVNIPYLGYVYGVIQTTATKVILVGLGLIYIMTNLIIKKINSNR